MDPPPWAPPPRSGVELRVRGVTGLPPAPRTALTVTVACPSGDAHTSSESPVIAGRARLEAWARLALAAEPGAARELTFEVHRVSVAVLGARIPTRRVLMGRAVLRVPPPPPRGGAADARFRLAFLPLAAPGAPCAVVDVEAQHVEVDTERGVPTPTLELAWRLAAPDAAALFEAEVPVTPLPRAALGYGHGGFMGVAASMMADERWRTILALEDASSFSRAAAVWHAAAAAAARGDRDRAACMRAATKRLMTLLENSPVLCAYGMLRWGAVKTGGAAPSPDAKPTRTTVSLHAIAAAAAVDAPDQRRHSSDVGAPPSPALEAGAAAVPDVAAVTPPPLPELSPMPRPPLATVDEASTLELSSLGQAAAAAAAVAAARDLPREGGRGDAAPVVHLPADGDAAAHRLRHRPSADGQRWGVRARELLRSASDAWAHARRGSGHAPAPSPLAATATVPARLLTEWAAEVDEADGATTAAPWPARGPPPAAPSVAAAAEAAAEPTTRPPPLDIPPSATAPAPPSPPVGGGPPPLAPWAAPRPRRFSDAGLVTPAAPLPGECDPGGSEDEEEEEEDDDGSSDGAALVDGANTHPTTARHRVTPVPIEWDVWLCPRAPWLLQAASVDHGSLRRLVSQAVYTRLPGCGGAARRAGEAGIAREGISPPEWLSRFGRAVNRAVAGDPDRPLDVGGGEAPSFRHRVSVDVTAALITPPALRPPGSTFYARATIVHGARVVPVRTAAAAPDAGGRVVWNERLAFWPVDAALPPSSRVALRVDVRRVSPAPGGPVAADTWVARVELPLGRQVQLGGSGGERAWWRADAARRRAHPPASEPASTDPSAHGGGALSPRLTGVTLGGGGVPGGGTRLPTDDDSSPRTDHPPDGAPVALRLRVTLDRVPTLTAAAAVGVAPAAAQTAAALLAAPGGVVLDVKSAYSTPRDLELFVNALDGIGVAVRAVASFRSIQLDGVARRRAPTVTLFHGLASLEAAAAAGALKRGGCVFFNGASLLRDAAAVGDGGGGATTTVDPTRHPLVDPAAYARFVAAAAGSGALCGVYIQEHHASPAAVDALSTLAAHPATCHRLPLGFAYGGAPGRAAAAFGSAGRGFGRQAFIEDVSRTEPRSALRKLAVVVVVALAIAYAVTAATVGVDVKKGWIKG